MNRLWRCVGLALGACFLALASAALEIRPRPAAPTVGQAMELELLGPERELAGARLVAEYRPGSQIARRELIDQLGSLPSDRRRVVLWRPQRAGLVRLELRGGSDDQVLARHDLGVRYRGVPRGGAAVLVLAGLALACGIGVGLRG